MKLLATHTVHHNSGQHHIRFYQGDLTEIPTHEAVDLLVVSAFRGNYLPTKTSLVGSLHRIGVSMTLLARHKDVDLTNSANCWLSRDLHTQRPDLGFRRILCFEPPSPGSAPEVVGDVFRAIMPFALADPPIHSIALPLLATGDQQADPEVMLRALFDASIHWFRAGLPIKVIKIVVRSELEAARLAGVFRLLSSMHKTPEPPKDAQVTRRMAQDASYDVFVSYAHADSEPINLLVNTLITLSPGTRIFVDKLELKPGEAWQSELDAALESCRKVITAYSPEYLISKVCLEEFNMARLRHRESDQGVLVPIYLRTAELPLYMRTLQFLDCRECDPDRVRAAGAELSAIVLSQDGSN